MNRKPYEKRIKEIHSAMSDLTVQLVDCYDNVSKLKSLFHNDNFPPIPVPDCEKPSDRSNGIINGFLIPSPPMSIINAQKSPAESFQSSKICYPR